MLYAGRYLRDISRFFVRHKTVVPKLNNLSIFEAENVIEGNMLARSHFCDFIPVVVQY